MFRAFFWIFFSAIICATFFEAQAGNNDLVGPDEFRAHWQGLAKAGNYDEAVDYCSKRLESTDLKLEALICLANIKFAEAEKNLMQIDTVKMGLGPGESGQIQITDPDKFFSPTVLYDQNGIDNAVAFLDRALAMDSSRVDVWKGKAYILQKSGRHKDLLVHLKKAAEQCPTITRDDLDNYAVDYVEAGKHRAAVEVYEVLAEVYPDDFVLTCDTGSVYAMMGEFENAVRFFERAHDLDEDDILVTNLANVNIYLGKINEALPFLQKMYEKYPKNVEDQYRYLLATVAADKKQGKKLAKNMKNISDPSVKQLAQAIRGGFIKKAALDAAGASYEKGSNENALLFAEIAGDMPQTRYLKALTLERLHHYKGVIGILTTYLKETQGIDPEVVANAHSHLGYAYLMQGQHEEAKEQFEQSIAMGTKTSYNYFYLGESHRALRDLKKAVKAYENAIKINDHPESVGKSKYRLEEIGEK